MAEFQEVMREWVRSRKAINENKLSCCPLEMFTDDFIANIEKEVMSWAAEHPEPVYPTWMEYLMDVRLDFVEAYNGGNDTMWRWLWTTPIPSDIAEKLGVKPKEG